MWLFPLAIPFFSCQDHDVAQAVQVFQVGQEPGTFKYSDLQRDQTNFVFTKSLDDGPATDEDGTRHSMDKQPRPDVVQLAGTFGGKVERSLVIPKDRYIFADMYSNVYWYYEDDACDPNFYPAPGQSPLDFLKENFPDMKKTSTLSVVLNGQELVTDANREGFYTETAVFPFKPHKDFNYPDCDYSAKTAKAYAAGYSMLLKLPPGNHTLVVKASDLAPDGSGLLEGEVVWHLTVQ